MNCAASKSPAAPPAARAAAGERTGPPVFPISPAVRPGQESSCSPGTSGRLLANADALRRRVTRAARGPDSFPCDFVVYRKDISTTT